MLLAFFTLGLMVLPGTLDAASTASTQACSDPTSSNTYCNTTPLCKCTGGTYAFPNAQGKCPQNCNLVPWEDKDESEEICSISLAMVATPRACTPAHTCNDLGVHDGNLGSTTNGCCTASKYRECEPITHGTIGKN